MSARRPFSLAASAVLALALASCDNMQHQQNLRAFDPTKRFSNGASARVPPPHTLAREDPLPGDPEATGLRDGEWSPEIPIPLDRALLERGRARFNIFCADCHGEDGYGTGIIVRRGFPQPPSFHARPMRDEPTGRIFGAITHGSGVMYGFADRIAPRDRWAIVAYVRALQKSQNAALSDLTAEERRRLSPP